MDENSLTYIQLEYSVTVFPTGYEQICVKAEGGVRGTAFASLEIGTSLVLASQGQVWLAIRRITTGNSKLQGSYSRREFTIRAFSSLVAVNRGVKILLSLESAFSVELWRFLDTSPGVIA